MTTRFEGLTGSRAIREVLLDHHLVQHNSSVAAALAGAGKVVAFDAGQSILTQHEVGADVYFILSGEATVFVNDRQVAVRGHHEAVGELAAIDPAVPRSATVKARGRVVALQVRGVDFEAILDSHPAMWKPIAKIAAGRLRERGRFHSPPNPHPILFLGSSTEELELAREFHAQLKHDSIEVRPWTTGVFDAGGVSIDSLLAQVRVADFAVFVLGPDDKVESRTHQYSAPRDNVILEIGLFMGRIGRDRVFMLREQGATLKTPTDLLGVTPLTFVRAPGHGLGSSLIPPSQELRSKIASVGVF